MKFSPKRSILYTTVFKEVFRLVRDALEPKNVFRLAETTGSRTWPAQSDWLPFTGGSTDRAIVTSGMCGLDETINTQSIKKPTPASRPPKKKKQTHRQINISSHVSRQNSTGSNLVLGGVFGTWLLLSEDVLAGHVFR